MAGTYPMTLWALRGITGEPAVCSLAPLDTGECQLTVILGDEEIYTARYVSVDLAIGQAVFVRDDLLANGWTES